ncbi:MAG: hypothetical protein BWX81_01962 [Spirochaetes bacterium ADurb.Bin110]|nr:MAG: hypothetical protein BWX81_01962 [Spirochaetes bacterium ADurb.Bin110]
MKRTLRIILFIGTFVLLALIVGYVAWKIGEIRLLGEQSASAEYSILRNAASLITSEEDLGDQFVRDRLKSLYNASTHLLAVQVLDRNGLVLWKMPDESPYFASPATNPGSVFRAPGMSTVIYMTPLPDGMKLMALYSILSQRDISNILLVPAIILVAWIVLLVVLQLVLKEKPKEPKEEIGTEELPEALEKKEYPEKPLETAFYSEEALSAAQENIENPAIQENIENIEEEQPEEIAQKEVKTSEITQAAQPESEAIPMSLSSSDDFLPGEFVAPAPQAEEETEEVSPSEVFPSTLSLGELERSLDIELRRDQETSLLLIHCLLSGESDPSALALGVTIRDYFASESLVFELGKGCYAAVLPGTDAGSALKVAVDLDDVLTTTASLYKDLSEEAPFYFGISARYNRMISPDRLYREAFAALEEAHGRSGSRILAFKPASAIA